MSMIRHPAVYTAPPSRNLVPPAGSAVWYPLHDSSLEPGVPDCPALTADGTPAADPWVTDCVYTFQTANTTNGLSAVDDIDDLYNDSQLSLVGSAVGDQFMVALWASYTVAPNGNAQLYAHGKDTGTATVIGLQLSSSEVPIFYHRSKGQSTTNVSETLTADSGTFTSLKNTGLFAVVVSLRPTSVSADLTVLGATALFDIAVHASNGTQSCIYASTGVDFLQYDQGGRELPGVSGGVSMANFGALTIGCRLNSSSALSNFWGRNTACVGAIGGFAARRFATYSSTRAADTITSMLARPHEFPRTFCLDYS